MNVVINWPLPLQTAIIYLKIPLENFLVKLLYVLLLTLAVLSCSLKMIHPGGIPISRIIVEDSDIKVLFASSGAVDTVYASWRNKRIYLYYRIKGQPETYERIYKTDDGLLFKARTIEGVPTQGQVFSLKVNSEITWDELGDTNPQDLILKISVIVMPNNYRNMIYIKGGWFRMGSKLRKDESPVHTVYVDDFYLDKNEVTVAEYRAFCRTTNRKMPVQPDWNYETHPVVNVSWENASIYSRWLGKRLPTEAEWEYAARSGGKRYFYAWGREKPYRKRGGNVADESIRTEKINWIVWKGYYDGFIYTAPISSFYSNEFGLHDMTGNVWEWCSDWYAEDYYKNSTKINPGGPSDGNRKVLRGGSWNMGPLDVRTTRRLRYRTDVTLNYLGFRCARNIN